MLGKERAFFSHAVKLLAFTFLREHLHTCFNTQGSLLLYFFLCEYGEMNLSGEDLIALHCRVKSKYGCRDETYLL